MLDELTWPLVNYTTYLNPQSIVYCSRDGAKEYASIAKIEDEKDGLTREPGYFHNRTIE